MALAGVPAKRRALSAKGTCVCRAAEPHCCAHLYSDERRDADVRGATTDTGSTAGLVLTVRHRRDCSRFALRRTWERPGMDVRRVDALLARELMASGITVIDVLPTTVYQQEHLPAARNLPLETFDAAQAADLNRTAPLLVYCFDQH
jgi:hypothetical protein